MTSLARVILLWCVACIPVAAAGGDRSFHLDSTSVSVVSGPRERSALAHALDMSLHTLAFVVAGSEDSIAQGARASIEMSVGPDGRVGSSRLVKSGIGIYRVETGIVSASLRWRFPVLNHAGATTFRCDLVFGNAVSAPVAQSAPQVRPSAKPATAPAPSRTLTPAAQARAADRDASRDLDQTLYQAERKLTAGGAFMAAWAGLAILGTVGVVVSAAVDGGSASDASTPIAWASVGTYGVSGVCLISGVTLMFKGASMRRTAKAMSAGVDGPGVILSVEF